MFFLSPQRTPPPATQPKGVQQNSSPAQIRRARPGLFVGIPRNRVRCTCLIPTRRHGLTGTATPQLHNSQSKKAIHKETLHDASESRQRGRRGECANPDKARVRRGCRGGGLVRAPGKPTNSPLRVHWLRLRSKQEVRQTAG